MMTDHEFIRIVFDGPPSHESGRFIEVETEHGNSISFGEWIEGEDGFWYLQFPNPANEHAKLRMEIASDNDELLDCVIEEAKMKDEIAKLKRENGKLTAWQELTVGSLLFWLEGEIGLDFATHAKRLLRDVCTCENEPPLCRICDALKEGG